MSTLAHLLAFAVCVLNVQARDEVLVHGWVSEPPGRGTWSILWSCLATIFICTWSALHLDVPEKHGRWYLIFRKMGYMLVAATAPEIVLYNSADNFFEARDLLKYLRNRGFRGWTLTHTQFANSQGFWTRTPQGEESNCKLDRLRRLIEDRDIDGPPISEEELKSRGKGDWVIKLIAVVQIIWFVVQTLFRAIEHFQTTALEIMTVAFVFCSVFIYGFSLNQPQDVGYPVYIEISDAAMAKHGSASAATPTTPARDEIVPKQKSERSIHAAEEGAEPTRQGGIARPSQYVPGWAADTVPVILFGLFASGFGALHCLAWNSPFPTSKEQLAWRICSATTTAVPAAFFLLLVPWFWADSDGILVVLVFLVVSAIVAAYVIGRITIIVLAFISLRTLPADALRTVSWNDYIPHFAA